MSISTTSMSSPLSGDLKCLDNSYVHQNLSYRFVSFQSDDSDVIVRSLEKQIQSGAFGLTPILNGDNHLERQV